VLFRDIDGREKDRFRITAGVSSRSFVTFGDHSAAWSFRIGWTYCGHGSWLERRFSVLRIFAHHLAGCVSIRGFSDFRPHWRPEDVPTTIRRNSFPICVVGPISEHRVFFLWRFRNSIYCRRSRYGARLFGRTRKRPMWDRYPYSLTS